MCVCQGKCEFCEHSVAHSCNFQQHLPGTGALLCSTALQVYNLSKPNQPFRKGLGYVTCCMCPYHQHTTGQLGKMEEKFSVWKHLLHSWCKKRLLQQEGTSNLMKSCCLLSHSAIQLNKNSLTKDKYIPPSSRKFKKWDNLPTWREARSNSFKGNVSYSHW